VTGITEHLNRLEARISEACNAADRPRSGVSVLAVSKRHSTEAIEAAAAAGITDFGENYVAEAVDKIKALNLPVNWHYIGRIQSNKTRGIAACFDWAHTVDRTKIAKRLSEQRPAELQPLKVLLQVQVDAAGEHGGVAPAKAAALAAAVDELPNLELRGLMCIPLPADSEAGQRQPFRELRELADRLADAGHTMDTLSMGMSGDLEAAIMEGSTLVRIGTAIFGPRDT